MIVNKASVSFLVAALVSVSCGEKLSVDEKDSTLRLDFPTENLYDLSPDGVRTYTVDTDALTYSFDIVSGAGGYVVTVEDYKLISGKNFSLCGGRATIEGNTVSVELLRDVVKVNISDKAGAEAHVLIFSSNEAVKRFGWYSCIAYGGPSRSEIGFGAGAPYRILYYSDPSAGDAVMEGSTLKTGHLEPGRHWYLIEDCRGTVGMFEFHVRGGYDIVGKTLTVSSKADTRLTFPFKWGKGWKVAEGETGWETFVYNIGYGQDSFFQDTFVVHVGDESASWRFVDKDGNRVDLTIEIE